MRAPVAASMMSTQERAALVFAPQGGRFGDPIVNLWWPYNHAAEPTPAEVAKEYNGRALVDLKDPADPTKVTRKAGEQLAGFAELKDDGSTVGGAGAIG